MDREEGRCELLSTLMRGRVEIWLWDSYLSFETRSRGPMIAVVDQIVVESIVAEIVNKKQ